jgi:hypothetical protein
MAERNYSASGCRGGAGWAGARGAGVEAQGACDCAGLSQGHGVCGRTRGWRGGARCTVARGVDGRVGTVGRSR